MIASIGVRGGRLYRRPIRRPPPRWSTPVHMASFRNARAIPRQLANSYEFFITGPSGGCGVSLIRFAYGTAQTPSVRRLNEPPYYEYSYVVQRNLSEACFHRDGNRGEEFSDTSPSRVGAGSPPRFVRNPTFRGDLWFDVVVIVVVVVATVQGPSTFGKRSSDDTIVSP